MNDMVDALQRAIAVAGGPSALADKLKISSQAVSQWKTCPQSRVLAVEEVTGVTRSQLRPDLYSSDTPLPIENIRKNVLKVSHVQLAAITESSERDIFDWEVGRQNPGAEEMRRIRDYAISKGLAWDDTLFFEVPAESPANAS